MRIQSAKLKLVTKNLTLLLTLLLASLNSLESWSSGNAGGGGSTSNTGSAKTGEANPKFMEKAIEEKRLAAQKQLQELSKQKQSGNIVDPAKDFDHSHKKWTELLQVHVRMIRDGKSSEVDYKNFNRPKLQEYLSELTTVTESKFQTFSREQKFAYLINGYNAFTIELILRNYPLKSIKKIGGFLSSPWSIEFVKMRGVEVSLDTVEHKWIRKEGKFKDPRAHFALNCASIGCPALRPEAFLASKLDAQLEEATIQFLKDEQRNKWDSKKKQLEVSSIFKWFREDFSSANSSFKDLHEFFLRYSKLVWKEVDGISALIPNADIDFLDYDWNLNDLSKQAN